MRETIACTGSHTLEHYLIPVVQTSLRLMGGLEAPLEEAHVTTRHGCVELPSAFILCTFNDCYLFNIQIKLVILIPLHSRSVFARVQCAQVCARVQSVCTCV